jgi:hypothetical protein
LQRNRSRREGVSNLFYPFRYSKNGFIITMLMKQVPKACLNSGRLTAIGLRDESRKTCFCETPLTILLQAFGFIQTFASSFKFFLEVSKS